MPDLRRHPLYYQFCADHGSYLLGLVVKDQLLNEVLYKAFLFGVDYTIERLNVHGFQVNIVDLMKDPVKSEFRST